MKLITITFSPCEDDKVPFSYEEDGFIRWVDEVFQISYKKSPETPFPTLEQAFILLEKLGYKWEITDPPKKCYLCESEEKLVPFEEGSSISLCPPCVIIRNKYEKHAEHPEDGGLTLFYQAFREGREAPFNTGAWMLVRGFLERELTPLAGQDGTAELWEAIDAVESGTPCYCVNSFDIEEAINDWLDEPGETNLADDAIRATLVTAIAKRVGAE